LAAVAEPHRGGWLVTRAAVLCLSVGTFACGPPVPQGRGGGGGNGDAGVTAGADGGAWIPGDAGSGPRTDAGSVRPDSPQVDPSCVDGQYSEALPTPEVSVDDLAAGYRSGQAKAYYQALLNRRFPLGWHLIDGALREASGTIGDCVDTFVRDQSSAAAVEQRIGTAVHECGHFLDIARGMVSRSDVYVFRADLMLSCGRGDALDRGGMTFARSRITADEYSSERPPCNGDRGDDCDSYADIYLDGNPDDETFDSGDQGFNMLAEEALQYINSLATAYAIHDRHRFTVSARDGILTHLWWIERYLRYARLNHSEAHDFLLSDPCWRQTILSIWGRAWLYLGLTDDIAALGIHDDALLDLVETPELLDEIQRVRDAEGCD
jgi:hypothetical protein